MRGRALTVCLAVAGIFVAAGGGAQESLKPVLQRASRLAEANEYQKVVELLAPLEDPGGAKLDDATRFQVRAELGRAYFHLGQYERAYGDLRAALDLQPQQMEIGVYVEAAAWATGRRDVALQIFEAILRAGARDLYLAVTLPGERSFLADADVWSILDRNRWPLNLDLKEGSLGGARLGDSRSTVASRFGISGTPGAKPVIMARAGPKVLWIFHFDDGGHLDRILVNLQHILRYSPYALEGASGLDWRTDPAGARKRLGPPDASSTAAGGDKLLSWVYPGVTATLEFGRVPEPLPPSVADPASSLLVVDLRRTAVGAPAARREAAPGQGLRPGPAER